MSEIRFKVLGDFSDFKKELQNAFKQKFKVGATGSDDSGSGSNGKESKSGKKSNRMLSFIGGKIALLASAALALKPIRDIISLFFNFAAIGIFTIIKWIKGLVDMFGSGQKLLDALIKKGIDWLAGKIGMFFTWLGDKIAEGWNWLGTKIAEWWGKAITWIKELPAKIWEWLKNGFDWLVEGFEMGVEKIKTKLLELKDKFVEKIKELKERFVEKIKELKDKTIEKLKELKDKLVTKFGEMKDDIVEWLKKMWEKFKDVPDKIKSAVKSGMASVASSLRKIVDKLIFWKKDKDDDDDKPDKKVNDAIITKDGKVIETHPDDTIIATKTPGSMGGGTVINFYGLTMPEAIEKVKRELGSDTIKSTRF